MPPSNYLGVAKTMYNSNVTELRKMDSGGLEVEILLSERLSRKKWDGSWPISSLEKLNASKNQYQKIVENRDLSLPKFKEDLLNKNSPFFDMLEARGLDRFLSQKINCHFMGHHLAHAYSALYQAPFEEMFILVMDGGGSTKENYQHCNFSKNIDKDSSSDKDIEHTSLFYWDGFRLHLIEQSYLEYKKEEGAPFKLADAIGSFYERVAQVIFNDNLASGKVMGLAGFGKSFYQKELSLLENQKNIQWDKRFQGETKKEWQVNPHLDYWRDLAATVQEAFEHNLFHWADKVKKLKGGSLPLVFSGGCALNCTANFKLMNANKEEQYFSDLFIPPNPGDEGISLGLAYGAYLDEKDNKREVIPYATSFMGAFRERNEGLELFKNYSMKKLNGDFSPVVKVLEDEAVIAWFQGRSECGPRALGHRSLLSDPTRKGIKDYLNRTIKFREEFRPYGASVLKEEATRYFDCPFDNPFMSYAVPIVKEYRESLKEICHVDGTCRMQTVDRQRDLHFTSLLESWKETGHYPILLNTSLNIMGQPIVESARDLLNFFENSPVNSIVFDDWLIQKKVSQHG